MAKKQKLHEKSYLQWQRLVKDEGAIDEQEGDIIENLIKLDDMPVEDIDSNLLFLF